MRNAAGAGYQAGGRISPLTRCWFPEDNSFGVPGGMSQLVADRYAFSLAPPQPGEHAVTGSNRFEGEGGPLAVTMTVAVQEPQVGEPAVTPEGSPEAATPVALRHITGQRPVSEVPAVASVVVQVNRPVPCVSPRTHTSNPGRCVHSRPSLAPKHPSR